MSNRRIAVHPTADAVRAVRGGHPWVWDGSIERVGRDGIAGDLAVVFDRSRRFVGIGLYDPASPIRVRVLHAGEPRPIDDAFFLDRTVDAIDRRQSLLDDSATTGFRLIHGENDHLPGLVVDRYAESLVVRLDTVAWLPHLRAVLDPLVEMLEPERIVLRTSRRLAPLLPPNLRDGQTLIGEAPVAPVTFLEHGLSFEADLVHGQKTGHFLDQRDNRALVATRCNQATVLDVFCNTGGFSVHAAAAGAREVHSIDSSEHAIAATRRHVELNRANYGSAVRHRTSTDDAFDAMEALVSERARFDVVIVDPPSFAPNAAAVPAARRAYRRLSRLALELLGTGGTLFQASCSSRIGDIEFHDLIADEVDAFGWKSTREVRTTHAPDHPIGFPEGAYLKGLLADVVPRA